MALRLKSCLNQQFPFFSLSNKIKAKGKECNTNQDCALQLETTCVKDFDYVMRCLCGNYEAPRNGKCDRGPKGVRHRCSHDNDCDEFMLCKENNSTSKGTFVGAYGRSSMQKES